MSAVKHNRLLTLSASILLVACIALILIIMRFRTTTNKDQANQPTETERRIIALLDLAEKASDSGDLTRASKLFNDLLELDPNNAKALIYSAGLRQQAGEFAEARKLLSKVPDTPSNFGATARYLEGTIELAEHRSRKAEQLLLTSCRLNLEYQPPLRVLARLYALQLRGEELLSTLRTLALKRPLSIEELTMKLLAGRSFVEQGEALSELRQRVASDSEDVHSIIAQARHFLAEGDTESVVGLLKTVSLSLKDDVRIQATLTLARELQGDASASESVGTEIILSGDSPPEAWELASRRAGAREDWKTVAKIERFRLSRNPFSPAISHALATALDRLQMSDSAKSQHKRTKQLDHLELLAYRMTMSRAKTPEVAVPLICEIADLLSDLEFPDDSIQWLLAADTLSPGTPEIRDRLTALTGKQRAETISEAIEPPDVPRLVISSIAGRPPAGDGTETGWRFRDVASESGLLFEYCNGNTKFKRIVETIGGGSAILDLDGDMWPDIYFPQGKPVESPLSLNDRLFRNRQGKHFTDCTDVAGIQDFQHSLSATVADFDNDGFPDIFVTNAGNCTLFQNLGDGTFSDVTPQSIRRNYDCSSCACFADLNHDGSLDLFVVNYVAEWDRKCVNAAGDFSTCHPHDLPLARNRVYQNSGHGDFIEVTDSAGMPDVTGRGLGVVAADFNCDQETDLFVANDGTPNMLFQSQPLASTPADLTSADRSSSSTSTIRIVNFGDQYGVAVPSDGRAHAGMGIAMSDFDKNGFLDLFVTNFFREQNTLYSGLDCGLFVDKSQVSGLGFPSLNLLGFGTQALDVDADGYDDLVIANGDIDDYSQTGRPWKMPMLAFRNRRNGEFADMSVASGPDLMVPQIGRGLTRVDFDGDQMTDLVSVRHDGAARLLKNETHPALRTVRIRLMSRHRDRDAIGQQVTLKTGEHIVTQTVTSGDGFSASNERILSFSIQSNTKCLLQVRNGSAASTPNASWLELDPLSRLIGLLISDNDRAIVFSLPR